MKNLHVEHERKKKLGIMTLSRVDDEISAWKDDAVIKFGPPSSRSSARLCTLKSCWQLNLAWSTHSLMLENSIIMSTNALDTKSDDECVVDANKLCTQVSSSCVVCAGRKQKLNEKSPIKLNQLDPLIVPINIVFSHATHDDSSGFKNVTLALSPYLIVCCSFFTSSSVIAYIARRLFFTGKDQHCERMEWRKKNRLKFTLEWCVRHAITHE